MYRHKCYLLACGCKRRLFLSRMISLGVLVLVLAIMCIAVYTYKANSVHIGCMIGRHSNCQTLTEAQVEDSDCCKAKCNRAQHDLYKTEKIMMIKRNYSKPKPKVCKKLGNFLNGPIEVNLTVPRDNEEVEDFLASANLLSGIKTGGTWKPTDCKTLIKTAIIIPYRKRSEQLRVLIKHLHPILQKQLIHYRIFVINQAGTEPWNKGRLLNSGVKEVLKLDSFDCFVFNDIDMFVKNDKLLHNCPMSPLQMSSKLDNWTFIPPSLFGGVIALQREHFEDINGFSNLYWQWGAEDDDLYWRLNAKGYEIMRAPIEIGSYKMMKGHHFRSDGWNPQNAKLVGQIKEKSMLVSNKQSTDIRWMTEDGHNSVKYLVTEIKEYSLYTLISVVLNKN